MHFNCPSCKQRLEIENDRIGEHLPCPACERMIRVPSQPLVIRKGANARSGVRLVPIHPDDRKHRKGSLADRMALMRAAQEAQDDPQYL